jgi:hypothetical protein
LEPGICLFGHQLLRRTLVHGSFKPLNISAANAFKQLYDANLTAQITVSSLLFYNYGTHVDKTLAI